MPCALGCLAAMVIAVVFVVGAALAIAFLATFGVIIVVALILAGIVRLLVTLSRGRGS